MIEASMQVFPAPDPIPLPAPLWLAKTLLWVTFTLHLLAMNALVGGALLAVWLRLRDKSGFLYQEIKAKLPNFMAATITLGVAPLLFAQVLYGQALYTSSILMAWPWLLSLALLVLAYYGFYLQASKKFGAGGRGGGILSASLLLVLCVGFLFTNNMTLMVTPEKWSAIYSADPSGWNLNLDEATLVPRYLHFVVAAVAVAGLLLAIWGGSRWETQPDQARPMVNLGARTFLWASMAQFAGGFWFLLSLPSEKVRLFMGQSMPATLILVAGVVAGIVSMIFLSRARGSADPRPRIKIASALLLVTLLLMVVTRDQLRDAYLEPWFKPVDLEVQTQYSPLLVFLVLFLGGVGFWFRMMRGSLREAAGDGEQ